MTKRSVAVIQGGPSTEAEVSRASAKSVGKALKEAGHHAVRLELDAFLADSLRTGGYDVVFPITHGAVGEDGCLQGLIEVMELPHVFRTTVGGTAWTDAQVGALAELMFKTPGPTFAVAKIAITEDPWALPVKDGATIAHRFRIAIGVEKP